MKEGERLRRWEGEIRAGQRAEVGIRNAERKKKTDDRGQRITAINNE